MSISIPSFGFITMAFGHKKYLQQAEALALSLKRHMPGFPIAIICDRDPQNPVFDYFVPIDAAHGLGTLQKAWLDQYSPFEQTFFIDSDCLVTRPFHTELTEIRAYEFTPIMGDYLGSQDRDDLYMDDLGNTLRILGVSEFPKFNGGVYCFKKGTVTSSILQEARHIIPRAKELGLKSFDRGGVADETIIGLALALLHIRPLYQDHGALMRTPIGMTGQLTVDVLGGGCHFIKWGEPVSPAICHFAAPYSRYSLYAYQGFLIRYPDSGPFIQFLARHFYRVQRKLINIWNGQK
jgi:hypothetical protein